MIVKLIKTFTKGRNISCFLHIFVNILFHNHNHFLHGFYEHLSANAIIVTFI